MNSQKERRRALVKYVADLEEQAALGLVQQRLDEGDDPLAIVKDCQEGLRLVGLRYEKQEYYLAGLIMAGEIFREMIELVEPVIQETHNGNDSGLILLGTVQGDIHDIGKNNLILLLRCYGFTVIDLGVDVHPAEFLRQAVEIKPDIIGLSGLLTSSYDSMAATIRLLREKDDQKLASVPILIGGSQINKEVCEYVGADHWVTDAMNGVRLCQRLMAEDGQDAPDQPEDASPRV
jgi:methanogenic corrinoid protein MtbC1